MDFRPYSSQYDTDIIAILKRHFMWMSKTDSKDLCEWISPVFYPELTPESAVDYDEHPYSRGLVLVEEGHVVGYLGMITSRRRVGDRAVVYGSPTTWVIDEPYRLFLPKAVKILLNDLDVCADFTPRQSVEQLLCKIFKFKYCGKIEYRVFPVPNERDFLNVIEINDANICDNKDIKNEYENHKKVYGFKIVKIENKSNGQMGYVFYKRYMEEAKRVRILKLVNASLFADNCIEISWKIIRDEFYKNMNATDAFVQIIRFKDKNIPVCMECDEMLLEKAALNHPLVYEKNVARIIYMHDGCDIPSVDFLYSEISNMSCKV